MKNLTNKYLDSEQVILNKVHERFDQRFSLNVGKVSVKPAGDSLSRQTGHQASRDAVHLKRDIRLDLILQY